MLKKSNTGNIRISDTSAKILAKNVKAVYSVKKSGIQRRKNIDIRQEKTG